MYLSIHWAAHRNKNAFITTITRNANIFALQKNEIECEVDK